MTNEELMNMMTDMGLHEGGMENWVMDNAWVEVAKRVAAHEREECAKMCEEQMKAYMSSQYTTDPLGGFRERFAAEKCADAIRKRGEK